MFLCNLCRREYSRAHENIHGDPHCGAKHEESPSLCCGLPQACPKTAMLVCMNLMHCPLCLGLALLSVLRAASHLVLVSLRLSPWRPVASA